MSRSEALCRPGALGLPRLTLPATPVAGTRLAFLAILLAVAALTVAPLLAQGNSTPAVAGAVVYGATEVSTELLSPVGAELGLLHALSMAPHLLLTAGVASALTEALTRQERGAERERIVRSAVAAFVGADGTGRVHRAAVDAALALIGRPPGARASLVLGDREVASAGESGASGRLVLPIRSPEEEGALVLEAEPDSWAEAADTLASLADEVALARAAIAARERRVEQHSQALVHAATDVVTIVDAAGVVRFQSPSTQRALGYGAGELVGQDLAALVHPDDLAPLRDLLAAVVNGVADAPAVEVRLRDARGSWLETEIVASDLRDHPEVGGIVLAARSEAERKRMLRALAESRQRLRTVLDHSAAFIFATSTTCSR